MAVLILMVVVIAVVIVIVLVMVVVVAVALCQQPWEMFPTLCRLEDLLWETA